MKTQRTLAILWLGTFIPALWYWLWEFLNRITPAYDGIHARHSLVCLFGIVACIFLFRGARWARISIGIIALYFGVGTFWEAWEKGWMRVDTLACDGVFVFSLVTIVLLFFRRYEPNRSQIVPH
jgi:hypothetical protein